MVGCSNKNFGYACIIVINPRAHAPRTCMRACVRTRACVRVRACVCVSVRGFLHSHSSIAIAAMVIKRGHLRKQYVRWQQQDFGAEKAKESTVRPTFLTTVGVRQLERLLEAGVRGRGLLLACELNVDIITLWQVSLVCTSGTVRIWSAEGEENRLYARLYHCECASMRDCSHGSY